MREPTTILVVDDNPSMAKTLADILKVKNFEVHAAYSGAEQIIDYIFGKNATGYCFLTGFGSKRAMFPHHRPSGADGIEQPVPGFIIGGPNKDKQDKQQVTYNSDFPAKAYADVEGSYASNEVCINWNAPAVYVLGYLQQVRK